MKNQVLQTRQRLGVRRQAMRDAAFEEAVESSRSSCGVLLLPVLKAVSQPPHSKTASASGNIVFDS
jgi:hypothetical protein